MNPFVAMVAVHGLLLPGPGSSHRSTTPVVRVTSDGRSSGDAPPTMALLPDGRFRMGVPLASVLPFTTGDQVRGADRFVATTPDHEVAVDALFLDCFELTNEQFKAWLDAEKKSPSRELLDLAWNSVEHGKRVEGVPAGAEKLPVRAITFDEAQACARFLGKRLPTETEWEYAARRGHPLTNVYPWGGWNAWDPKRCASIHSSLRGAAITTFVGGSFADDRSFDGIFDLCGNVAEWTDSPFLAYPGFEPPKLDDHGKKRAIAPDFTSGRRVVRGGSSWGDAFTDNVVVRTPTAPGAANADVGFRCALSSLAGLDVLNEAIEDLGPVLRSERRRVELDVDSIAAQTIHSVDATARLFGRARHVAVARVREADHSLAETRRVSVDRPALVGVLAISEPATKPELRAGSYTIRFREKGLPKNGRLVTDKPHPDHGGRGAPTDATPPKLPSPFGGDVEAPRDRAVLLFEDEQGHVAGWSAVQSRDTTPHATRLAVAERDGAAHATFTLAVKEPRSGAALELSFELEFASGSFEPR